MQIITMMMIGYKLYVYYTSSSYGQYKRSLIYISKYHTLMFEMHPCQQRSIVVWLICVVYIKLNVCMYVSLSLSLSLSHTHTHTHTNTFSFSSHLPLPLATLSTTNHYRHQPYLSTKQPTTHLYICLLYTSRCV